MIHSIEVKHFRGIKEGKLEGLTPLVVLVGPNGCGKSTILDALLISGSSSPTRAIGEVVARHKTVGDASRWLFWKGNPIQPAEIRVLDGDARNYSISLGKNDDDNPVIWCDILDHTQQLGKVGTIFRNNSPSGYYGSPAVDFNNLDAHLLETGLKNVSLPELYSRATENGHKKEVVALMKEIIFGLDDIIVLTDTGNPYLSLLFSDYAIPNEITGEGIQALLRLTLELAVRPGGIVLLEEPETHQHPGALRQSARAIRAAMRRDIQVVISTHSIEFLDTLLSEVQSQKDLDDMSVFRLLLVDGCLRSARIAGSDIAFLRTEIGDDLR